MKKRHVDQDNAVQVVESSVYSMEYWVPQNAPIVAF